MRRSTRSAPSLAELRARLGLQDGRRFEYKSLRDRKRWHAILEWLSAFESVVGTVLVLIGIAPWSTPSA